MGLSRVAATTVPELLRHQAATSPTDAAFVVEGADDSHSMTFAAWDARSDSVAVALANREVNAGDRVALLFDTAHWIDMAVAYAGVQKVGAVAVPLAPRLNDVELSRVLRAAAVRAVVCPPHLSPSRPTGWIVSVAELEDTIGLADPPAPTGDPGPEELRYRPAPMGPAIADASSREDPCPRVGPPGPFLHAFTVGTLGARAALLYPLAGRGPTITLGSFDPERFCTVLAERRYGACGMSPLMARAILNTDLARRYELSSVSQLTVSPASAWRQLCERLKEIFPNARIEELAENPRPMGDQGHHVELAPAAPSQQGMLWYEQLAPGSFNMAPLVRRFRGNLRPDILERALAELAHRHAPIRTTFTVVDGAPVQVVRPPQPIRLPITDLSDLPAAVAEERVSQEIAEAAANPMDLVEGPLFTPRLFRLSAGDHVLVIGLHHSTFDDWSVGPFRRELAALYTGFLAGDSSPLGPALPTTFADFARGRHDELQGSAGSVQRSYWRHRLAGAPFVTELPIGHPTSPPTGWQAPAQPITVDLSSDLSRSVAALARDLRATPFMVMLAAFAFVVSQRTRRKDVLLASVVAQRDRTEFEGLVACFTKKVLLRLDLGGDLTFSELVVLARQEVLTMLPHQDLGFEAMLEEGVGDDALRHGVAPSVAVVFQAETPSVAKLRIPGVDIGPFVAASAPAPGHFAAGRGGEDGPGAWGGGAIRGTFLILSLHHDGERMALEARGAFHEPAVRGLLADYEALLNEVVAEPAVPLRELSPAVAAPGRHDRLTEFRGLAVDFEEIGAALGSHPDIAEVAVAVRQDRRGSTYLVAYVVPMPGCPAPPLNDLRTFLWSRHPGCLWPAFSVAVDAIPRDPSGRPVSARLPWPLPSPEPAPLASRASLLLGAAWAEAQGAEETSLTASYWQRFSFIDALAAARATGLPVPLGIVARCRTIEALATALGVSGSA